MGRASLSWKNATALTAKLLPDIEKLEKKRKWHLIFLIIMTPIMMLFTLPFIYLHMLGYSKGDFVTTTIATIAAAMSIWSIAYQGFDHDYRRKAKRVFMYKIAEALRMKYSPQGLFKTGQVYNHYIVPPYSTDKIEDGFVFKLSERRIELQEVKLNRTPRNERGILVRIEARKTQPFHTVLIPRSFLRGRYHRSFFNGMHHYERTPFGNPSFARRYDILSEEHTDAHDIFNPAFIETFIKLEQAFGAKSLSISFKKREIVIYARNAKDMFEPGHLLNPVSAETIRHIFDELRALNDMIETLKLNPYVGL